MKIKVTTTQTKEVEVQLPAYIKGSCHYYKVYSEYNCIQVCDADSMISIQIAHSGLAYCDDTYVECTEKEFKDAFNKVYDQLLNLTK